MEGGQPVKLEAVVKEDKAVKKEKVDGGPGSGSKAKPAGGSGGSKKASPAAASPKTAAKTDGAGAAAGGPGSKKAKKAAVKAEESSGGAITIEDSDGDIEMVDLADDSSQELPKGSKPGKAAKGSWNRALTLVACACLQPGWLEVLAVGLHQRWVHVAASPSLPCMAPQRMCCCASGHCSCNSHPPSLPRDAHGPHPSPGCRPQPRVRLSGGSGGRGRRQEARAQGH